MLHGDSWPGSESVDAMIREFAALLQPLFDDMRPEWSLREELEHISHYIALLRMRYCADFTVVNGGDAMADFRIPRFILQPVLENSPRTRHGGQSKPESRIARRGIGRLSAHRHKRQRLRHTAWKSWMPFALN